MIGHRLACYRQRNGLTQKEAARLIGVSAKYLGNVERGHERPSRRVIGNAAQLYGVCLDDIITEQDHSQDEEALLIAYREGDKLRAIAIIMGKAS